MKFPKFDFDNAPFKGGFLTGVSIGSGLCVIWLLLSYVGEGGQLPTNEMVFIFVLILIYMIYMFVLAGAPWSVWAEHGDPTLLSVAAGLLINGAILGIIVGIIAKTRQILRSRSKN